PPPFAPPKNSADVGASLLRRAFLRIFGGAAFASAISPRALVLPASQGDSPGQQARRALFQEIPGTKSGITWQHVNGRSPEYYLPETTGAGCAFFDYDSDGWMDIYLVNSGKCDFFTPNQPLRNALYKNNRDGTFTDVTGRAGVPGGGYGMGVAVGD